jgi:hypothetical protein
MSSGLTKNYRKTESIKTKNPQLSGFLKLNYIRRYGARGRNRTGTTGLGSGDFKSPVSTNFTTRAGGFNLITRSTDLKVSTY